MKFLKKDKVATPAVQSKNWYTDRYESVLVQRNLLLVMTLFALITTIFASLSIAWLMPKKSVEPFVIQIDERTGITQVVDPLDDKELSANLAVKRYFLYKYIVARQSFLNDEEKDRENYNIVRVMSENEKNKIYTTFRQQVSETNLDSPINRYSGFSLKVKVKSITFLNDTTAQIRFVSQVVPLQGFQVKQEIPYVAVVSFEFREVELTAEERYINPLGFMVVGYDINEEILN